jgi:hypothetical protein
VRRSAAADPLSRGLQTGTIKHAKADPEAVAEFLSRTGYDLPVAIADLVDNSIDAGASRVQISLTQRDGRPSLLAIADNGRGMTARELQSAVSLEKDPRKQDGRALGRYGVGLKAASFSIGRRLWVVTRSRGSSALGAVLDRETYKSGYTYQALTADIAEEILASNWGGRPLGGTGTVILVEDLVAMVPASDTSQDLFLKSFGAELDTRLALVFHRYLDSGRLAIEKSRRSMTERGFGVEFDCYELEGVNPFGYDRAGARGYPARLVVRAGTFKVPVALHLWPKQGRTKATRHKFYEILGRSGEWQGLYFYRHDRLLQTGGWNGLRSQEPHMSYARIEIDLPAGSDDEFRPTIMKDRIENPRPLLEALMAKPQWRRYIDSATKVYRGKPPKPTGKRAARSPAARRAPTRFVAMRERPSLRLVDGTVQLDRRMRKRLGSDEAKAVAEIVWLACRPALSRRRLSEELRRDLERLETAVARLADRH